MLHAEQEPDENRRVPIAPDPSRMVLVIAHGRSANPLSPSVSWLIMAAAMGAAVGASMWLARRAHAARENYVSPPWIQRIAAWLALAKAFRFALEFVFWACWLAPFGVLTHDAIAYQGVVTLAYLTCVPLLIGTARDVWFRDRRLREVGVTTAGALLAIELIVVTVRLGGGYQRAALDATGLAHLSLTGTAAMAAEALFLGAIAWSSRAT